MFISRYKKTFFTLILSQINDRIAYRFYQQSMLWFISCNGVNPCWNSCFCCWFYGWSFFIWPWMMHYRRKTTLTGTLPGERCLDTTSDFSQISKKRQRSAPPFLAQLFMHLFCTCCKNFRTRSHKVRSPGHVKWLHIRKSLNDRHSYTEGPITSKLSAIDIRNGIYKLYLCLGFFLYRWPKVKSTLRPFHFKYS